jgi:hypothetical protein
VIATMRYGAAVVSHEEMCLAAGVSADQANMVLVALARLTRDEDAQGLSSRAFM